MDKDSKPPPLTTLLGQYWNQLLIKELTEVLGESGYGKIIITVYNKSIKGIDSTKHFRKGNDNNI